MDERELIAKIKTRDKKLKDDAAEIRQRMQDIIEVGYPYMGSVFDPKSIEASNRVGYKRFDGTLDSALNIWADGIQGYMFSPATRWFMTRMAGRTIKDMPRVRQWLQEGDEQLYSAFNRSNFYSASNEFIKYGGGLGTGVVFTEEDLNEGSIFFDVRHPREIRFAQNKFGRVDVIHRDVTLSARNAVEYFGKENVSKEVRHDAENNPEKEHKFLHIIWPNKEFDPGKADYKGKEVASVYLEWGKHPKIVRKGGFRMSAAHVWRAKRRPSSAWGIGPAEQAMIDVLVLNNISRDLAIAGQNAVRPPWKIDASLRGEVSTKPDAHNYIENAHEVAFEQITNKINYPIGADREAKIRQAIEDRFNVNFFLMLARSEGQMTATEIMERQGEKAVLMGTLTHMITVDYLNPVMDRVFDIEMAAGRMPELPPELEELGGEPIDVDYVGPLAMLQKRLYKTQGIKYAIQDIMPLMEVDPNIIHRFDFDKAAQIIAEASGMPQSVIRDDKAVQEILEGMQQQQQMSQEAEMAEKMAGSISKLQKPVEQGSPVAEIAELL